MLIFPDFLEMMIETELKHFLNLFSYTERSFVDKLFLVNENNCDLQP